MAATSKPLPTRERVMELLDYDPVTGVFRWRVSRRGGVKAGAKAGSITPGGYRRITIDGSDFLANRLAWLIKTGDDPGSLEVDHKNRDQGDNRWKNLRLATHQQNMGNRRGLNNGLPKGVHRRGGKYWARLNAQWLGKYSTEDAASAAYLAAATEAYGEFACAA